MKYPASVKIMGSTVKIKAVDKIVIEGDDNFVGCYNHAQNTVELDATLDAREAVSTLCHELMHAWLHLSGNNELWGADERIEETLVWSMEHHLLPVIWDLAKSSKVKDLRPSESQPVAKAAKRRRK
jgi:hypothetical protein